MCSLFSFFLGYIWLSVLTTDEELPAYYTFAVWAVAVSCVIELSSLVVQLVSSAFLFVRLRVGLFDSYDFHITKYLLENYLFFYLNFR